MFTSITPIKIVLYSSINIIYKTITTTAKEKLYSTYNYAFPDKLLLELKGLEVILEVVENLRMSNNSLINFTISSFVHVT
jgi:hypothetical protein